MKTLNNHDEYYTPIQMKIPVDLEKIIEISDPIYTFNEIMEQIDLYKYFVGKGNKTGRPRFDSVKLLKIILFAYMSTATHPCSAQGDSIENLTVQADVYIKNCRFGKAKTHLHLQAGGEILLTGDKNYWFESSPINNLTIKHCSTLTFINIKIQKR